MQNFLSDLRLAIRQLAKSPGFTATAVLMLAFGIGATTAIFSIVEGVLLRPLPFPDSSKVVVVSDRIQGIDVSGNGEAGVTTPEIRQYTRDTHSFAGLGGYQYVGFELSGNGQPAKVNAARMTPGVFTALGVAPYMGRVYTEEETEHGQQVVVLSYGTWKNRFHGDSQVLNTKALLDRKPYIVIGVMPPDFEFPLNAGQLENRTELWVPMSFYPQELSSNAASNWSYQMVGRLKPGVSASQAQSDALRVAQDIMRNFPAEIASLRISPVVRPLQEETVEEARPLLRTLFLAVAVVLLIACANLAGLMLVRAIRKQREVAVRLALGADTTSLLQQTMVESLVLSVGGGLLGLGLAALALRAGKSLLPGSLPRISAITLNWNVVGFALLLAVITGLLCGIAPAFAALRTNVNGTLKEGGRSGSAGGGHARLRSTLVVAEIAIALVLLTASGLLLRSFEKMRAVDLGFRPEHVTTAVYNLPQKQYSTQAQVTAFNNELLRRLRELPGAQTAGLTSLLPASNDNNNQVMVVEGYVPPHGAGMNLATSARLIGDYMPAMGIPLLHGRYFTDADKAGKQLVVIVNQSYAQHYWPNGDAVGKRIRIGTPEMKTPWMVVVGVVADVKLSSPDEPTKQEYYVPSEQFEDDLGSLASPDDLIGNDGYIVLRSTFPPEQMENAIREAVKAIDPQLPLTQVRTMQEAVSQTEAPRRFNTVLISSFALAAVLLAVLGIYSVIAFSVASRVQEMAIRMALGSQRSGIIRIILTSAAKLAAVGCVLGLAGAMADSALLQSLLFGVSPFDPLVLLLAAVVVLLLAVSASMLPALRAASIDPMQALRGE
jgi:putative ABC transport system permease protein